MKLQRLSLADWELFKGFFSRQPHELSVYTFANIDIWRGLFDISWSIVDDNLCVFFQDKTGCFLYFLPLGKRLSPRAIEESFRLMDGVNKNPAVSRIENVEAQDAAILEKWGYRIAPKPGEYLCLSKALAELKGDNFKSKRAAVNFFTKHYEPRYKEFFPGDKEECLALYKLWSSERSTAKLDPVYRGMLKDNLICLETLFSDYEKLGLAGRVVEVNGRIKAFSAGFEINPETFCVLYEFADLSVKGLSQYIFQRFCQESVKYKYINIMDDSGLENLKIVKVSYRPLRLIPAFIADRKNG